MPVNLLSAIRAAGRIEDTRRRIKAIQAKRRAAVIRLQLDAMRATAP